MKTKTILMTPVEIQLAQAVGSEKTRDCDGYDSTIKMKSGFDSIGTKGEIAFADYMGIEWDWTSKKNGDGGKDFTVNGYTVDVKTTEGDMHNRHLMVDSRKVQADIYVQCLVSPDIDGLVTLVGWAWKDEVLATRPVRWEGFYNHNHVVHHADLHPMSEFPE